MVDRRMGAALRAFVIAAAMLGAPAGAALAQERARPARPLPGPPKGERLAPLPGGEAVEDAGAVRLALPARAVGQRWEQTRLDHHIMDYGGRVAIRSTFERITIEVLSLRGGEPCLIGWKALGWARMKEPDEELAEGEWTPTPPTVGVIRLARDGHEVVSGDPERGATVAALFRVPAFAGSADPLSPREVGERWTDGEGVLQGELVAVRAHGAARIAEIAVEDRAGDPRGGAKGRCFWDLDAGFAAAWEWHGWSERRDEKDDRIGSERVRALPPSKGAASPSDTAPAPAPTLPGPPDGERLPPLPEGDALDADTATMRAPRRVAGQRFELTRLHHAITDDLDGPVVRSTFVRITMEVLPARPGGGPGVIGWSAARWTRRDEPGARERGATTPAWAPQDPLEGEVELLDDGRHVVKSGDRTLGALVASRLGLPSFVPPDGIGEPRARWDRALGDGSVARCELRAVREHEGRRIAQIATEVGSRDGRLGRRGVLHWDLARGHAVGWDWRSWDHRRIERADGECRERMRELPPRGEQPR